MKPPVRLPGGKSLKVDAIGTFSLAPGVQLKDVLCVPDFTWNLLFVSKMTKETNCSITFYPDSCVLQDLISRKKIGKGDKRGGLYYFKQPHNIWAASSMVDKNLILWYRRLGHVPLELLFSFQQVALESIETSVFYCDSCHRAKQTRNHFGVSFSNATKAFYLIKMDVWGPYKTRSLSGCHYFLTLDDSTNLLGYIF